MAACQTPLEYISSFADCELYYDFSRGPNQRINNSIFTENNLFANIVNNEYVNISNPSNMIISNSPSSPTDYSVLFDMEFITSSVSSHVGYFWSADNGKYQFLYIDGEFGMSNKADGTLTFAASKTINMAQRHLVLYKSSLESVELYVDAIYKGKEIFSNTGLHSPYSVKLGGSVRSDRHFEAMDMKIYRYAYYSGGLTSNEIAEMCNITKTHSNTNVSTSTNGGNLSGMGVFGLLYIVVIPLCITMMIIVLCLILRYRYKRKRAESLQKCRELKNLRKKMKKLKQMEKDFDSNSNNTLRKNTEYECVICLDNVKEYICTPCGHWCLCKGCKDKVKKCPLCQSKCESIIRVFK